MTYKVCEPTVGQNEVKYAVDAILRGEISGKGDYVERFERAFGKLLGAKYAVAMNSGSTALLAALQAIGIKTGDEVICPTFTMAAPALAVEMLGAKCRWVDCREDGNIDADLIEEKITSKTKAIIVVHVYGIPAEMNKIREIAQKHNLRIIEDAAEAHGAKIGNVCVGTIGDIGCFSFYANKIITTGEGGMCVTNNERLYEKLKSLRDYSQKGFYVHDSVSLNYRLSSVLAAIGLAQCERFWEFVERRNQIADWYDTYLPERVIRERPDGSVNWMYGILIDNRDEVMARLSLLGIETRPFFVPMHQQPFNGEWDIKTKYPIAENLSQRGMYLPSSSHLTETDIKYIAKLIT
ncbi:MAG: DegT/DnrJ/EryC1/StrS family aminotransferase [Patescibacteria group bacterium]